jgi:hypothetical protein
MDGRRSKAKLQTVSVTGGMLALLNPLAEGDFVEIAFQTPAGVVQGMAEMLMSRRLFTTGYQQPFRFVALGDTDHQNLRRSVETTNDTNFLGMKTSRAAAGGWMT